MGLLETLTVIFVVLKLVGIIDWTWLWVLSPLIVSVTCYIFIGLTMITLTALGIRETRKF